MRDFLLALVVVALTAAETYVSTWEARADRQATSCPDNRFSKKAGWWAFVFETLLYAGMILVAREAPWLAGPGSLAAGFSKYHAVERRRKKFRSRTKRRKKTGREPVLSQGSPPEA